MIFIVRTMGTKPYAWISTLDTCSANAGVIQDPLLPVSY